MVCERIQPVIAKYQRWYDQIIARGHDRQLDEYSERHHILPRSLGGGDEETNLVTLTYREHFLAVMGNPRFSSSTPRRDPVVDRYWLLLEPG